MTDIIERLRKMDAAVADGGLYREAADEIERLTAALQWYADEDTWCKDVGGYGSAIHQDGGKRARRALEQKP